MFVYVCVKYPRLPAESDVPSMTVVRHKLPARRCRRGGAAAAALAEFVASNIVSFRRVHHAIVISLIVSWNLNFSISILVAAIIDRSAFK